MNITYRRRFLSYPAIGNLFGHNSPSCIRELIHMAGVGPHTPSESRLEYRVILLERSIGRTRFRGAGEFLSKGPGIPRPPVPPAMARLHGSPTGRHAAPVRGHCAG